MVDFKALSIKQRLAKIRKENAAAAPSMVPDYAPKKEAKKKEPVVDLETHPSIDGDDLATIRDLINANLAWMEEEKKVKAIREGIKIDLKEMCKKYNLREAITGEDTLSYFPVSRSTISAQKLLEKGVSTVIIAACTETTTSWSVRCGRKGANAETE